MQHYPSHTLESLREAFRVVGLLPSLHWIVRSILLLSCIITSMFAMLKILLISFYLNSLLFILQVFSIHQHSHSSTQYLSCYLQISVSTMALPAEHVRVLDLDSDVDEFPNRFAALLCDDTKNYHQTSVKHQLNRIWPISAADFKLAKPYILGGAIQTCLL